MSTSGVQYSPPKNDNPIFNPIEFLPKITVSPVSANVTALQEEIDIINEEIITLQNEISTIGLPNITIPYTATRSETLASGSQSNTATISFDAGVFLVKFMAYAECPQNDSLKYLISYFIGEHGTEQQNGFYTYAPNGNQQFGTLTFQQQFIVKLTAPRSVAFYQRAATINGGNISYNSFLTQSWALMGTGSPISILRIR